MYCSRCGAKNEDGARFCDQCGADLSAMPRAAAAPAGAPPPGPPPTVPPLYYPPARTRAWWYPIGVWVILASFFLFIDVVPDLTVSWAHWPIGVTGIFMVGLPLLQLLEESAARRRRFGP